jgi:ATP-binding cassette subfamily F protein uup
MARGTKQKARKQRVDELLQLRYDSGDERVAIALAARRLGNKVLDARGVHKSYDGRSVLDGVDLRLEPGDRIGIIGPNGAGKSTLLDILAGRQAADAGSIAWGDTVRVGYYDQRSADLRENMRLLEFIESEAALIRTKDGDKVEAAQMLEWFLFPRPMQYARIGSLSGGERRRLYLLRSLIHQPNVLLLDEPTNDLDIQTLAVLESYLDHFAGCLIVASHDRYFLDRTVDFLVAMEDGRLGPRYPGPYANFAARRAEAQAEAAPSPAKLPAADPMDAGRSGQPAAPSSTSSPGRKLTWKERRELEALDSRVAALEAQRNLLLDEINNCGDNYARVRSLSAQLETLETELDTALERWFELSSITEAAGA